MIERGEIWWVDFGPAVGSRPASRRPVLVISGDGYNASRIATIVVAAITTNTSRSALVNNIFLPAGASGLPRDSVVDTTQLQTINKSELHDRIGLVLGALMQQVDEGLRSVLGL